MATGLARSGIVALLSMVLSSAGGRLQWGAEHRARRTWWQLVPIPNPHRHVCRPLLFLADIELRWSSAAGSRTLRPQNLVMPCCYPKFPLCRPLLFLFFEMTCLTKGSSCLLVFPIYSTRITTQSWWSLVPMLGTCLLVGVDTHAVPFCSTLDATERCCDLVPALGIPSFLDCYLNIKPLLLALRESL